MDQTSSASPAFGGGYAESDRYTHVLGVVLGRRRRSLAGSWLLAIGSVSSLTLRVITITFRLVCSI